MIKRLKVMGLIATGLWAGCAPPTQIVPVPPPGMELRRSAPVSPDGEAQALGEQPAATAAAAKAAVASNVTTPPTPIGQSVTTKSGLKVETLKAGTGPDVKSGQMVHFNYVGKLANGEQFDASPPGDPAEFQIGVGALIKGWDEGVPGMKVGERRRLTVPPELGYGPQGKGKIPPNSTLVFEIEVVEAH